MAVAAASLPRSRQEDFIINNEKQSIAANSGDDVHGASAKVLINPIAAYSQQLADKQLHIARVSNDGVHWSRSKQTANNTVVDGTDGSSSSSSKRQSGYFKDKLLGRLTNKSSSDTALSGGMLDREFTDEEYAAAAARLDVGDTSRLDDGHAMHGASVPKPNSCMHPVGIVNGKTNVRAERNNVDDNNSQVTRTSTTTPQSKENGHVDVPSVKRTISARSSPLILPEYPSDTPAVASSDAPSRYGTPADMLSSSPSPSALGFHTPAEELDSSFGDEEASSSRSQRQSNASTATQNFTDGGAQTASTTSNGGHSIEGFPFAKSSSVSEKDTPSSSKPSTSLSQQQQQQPQQSKSIPPPLTALQFLPQANVIPPTPPTASTSASFAPQQVDTSGIDDAESSMSTSTSQKQTQMQQTNPPRMVPSSPKSIRTPPSPSSSSNQPPLYLSPESIRKASPSHKRSQSYQVSPAQPRASTSSSGSFSASTGPPLVTPGLNSSQPPRRTSLLPPITTSAAINFGSDAALRKRSMSPRRALSFRGSGSGTALPTPGGVLYDEPMSIEEQVEQRRQADQLEETIARQAEQMRQERLSKRIENQRAHEKALSSLREEQEARQTRGEDTGASALLSGSPPSREGLPSPLASAAAAAKGKERERGDTTSTTHTTGGGEASPTSPVSIHKQLWSSSPVAGEKAVLRGSDPGMSEKPVVYGKEKSEEPERVLVGNLIGEDHVNYVLMYNMLTGIRIGVSRCEAKNNRPLTDADYTAQHKFSFDIVGNELTPSARYDFKFKDYAPWVFRELRAHFHLDPADYLLSLTAKYILSELGSPGKSGSFFYFSRDYRFIIKTISHTEHKFFRKILKDYHKHVLDNPNTLISRFYGLHRVKLPHGRKIHFVIMNNLFPPHRDIHETFDLKGSSVGREYPEDLAAKKPRATLKDLNWIRRHRQIDFGPYKRAIFEEQLQRDVELLQRLKIMDYSLLIGIHDMDRGNKENLRDGMLTVFSPEGSQAGKLRRRPTHRGDLEREHNAAELRKAVQRADPQVLSNGTYQLPQKDKSERRYFIFYQDEGGIRATDQYDQNEDKIYYLGVIDILTPYNWKKRIEHCWRSLQYDKHRISAVPPKEYGDRFLGFLISSIQGGDQSKRPKME